MEFNARHGFVAGIDLGPTRTRLAVADLRGERARATASSRRPRGSARGAAAAVAGALRDLMEEAGVPDRAPARGGRRRARRRRPRPRRRHPRAEPEGLVARCPCATSWSARCGAPVLVENDVNLAVLGEHWRGAAAGHDTCAFIFVGTGIGAGDR